MCSTCADFEARVESGKVSAPYGAIAQLVERFHGMEEVAGSIPASSTTPRTSVAELAAFFGGLVAGEGCFTSTEIRPPYRDGSRRRRFVFSVEMGDDHVLLEGFHELLGAGSLCHIAPRRAGYRPTTRLSVSSNRKHLTTTVPFCDEHLLPSAKRTQYLRWRSALVEHLQAHPTRWGQGPSTCRVEGCPAPVRGRGLCRAHYYAETGW